MIISSRGRYALRIMLDLAIYNKGVPCSIKEISGREHISEKYMEQIISVLNKAGYVRSVRGSQGGYILRKKTEECTVGMILRLTESDLSPVNCVGENGKEDDKKAGCVTSRVWEQINDAISDVVDNITLADLVEWQMGQADHYVI